MLVVSLAATLLAGAADSKSAVPRLLEAIRTGDRTTYAEVAPKLVMMAAPDFGVPMDFDEAKKSLGACSVVSLSDPRALDGVPVSIVTATMTDGKLVHGLYPGGIERFYPRFARKSPPAPGK
jgi:hypothetical protein